MYVLGITGGIASGKSTVAKYLAGKKVPIVDADKICHKLSEPGGKIYRAYVEHFGPGILDENKKLNRQAIGSKVFGNEEELNWMNETMHPIIRSAITEAITNYAKNQAKIIILDIPLLFEAGWDKYCDAVWLVYVDQEEQIQRVMERDKTTAQAAKERIAAQMPLAEKKKLAHKLISTAGSFQETQDMVEELWQELMKNLNNRN